MLIERLYSGTNKNKKTWVGTTTFISSQSFSQLLTVNLQYSGIKKTNQCSDVNFVESVCILGWFGPYYATFWVNTRTYSLSLHIQSKSRKKFAPEKSSGHGHFPQSFAVYKLNFVFVFTLTDKFSSLVYKVVSLVFNGKQFFVQT